MSRFVDSISTSGISFDCGEIQRQAALLIHARA